MHDHTHLCSDSIENYFGRRGFRARLQACMLAPHWDELAAWLVARGHPDRQVYETLRHGLRLAEFADSLGIHGPGLLTGDLVDRCLADVSGQPRLHRDRRLCVLRVMAFLRERGLSPVPPSPEEPNKPLVAEYLHYLREHRGTGEESVQRHRRHVCAFVDAVEGKDGSTRQLDADRIFRFVTKRAQGMSRSQRKAMCAALRSFLRFLHVRGDISSDLSMAVPVIPSFKLDRLPAVLSLADIERILSVIDRSTAIGRRDYAMLLVLATYGLRAGQLCALRLDDIDWRHETMRIRGAKGGRDVMLPLRPSVGQAIVDYVRHGRPSGGSWREVFLRVRAPIKPLAGVVHNIIKPHARRAGLSGVPLGPHAWRHACASRMLASGQSLKTIRDVLGHQSIETTFIYTKIDISKLREAALEWPEVTP
jgi:integrase/recombinase XerD